MTLFATSSLWALLLVGCAKEEPFVPTLIDLSGEGAACITTAKTSGTAAVVAGATTIKVVFSDCSSGGDDETLSCSYTLDDTAISVTSVAQFLTTDGSQQPMCNTLSTSCDGPELTEGPWILTYGAGTTEFQVPAESRPCATNSGQVGGSGLLR